MENCECRPAPQFHAARPPRASVARSAPGTQWYVVDSAQRRALEKSAGSLRELQDGASAISTVGAGGRVGAGAPGPCAGSPRPGRAGPAGMLHLRNIRSDEKRKRFVGQSKRGNESKTMAIADRDDLRLAACPASARAVEVTPAPWWRLGDLWPIRPGE